MSNKFLLKTVVAFGLLAILLIFLGVNYAPRIGALSPAKESSASAENGVSASKYAGPGYIGSQPSTKGNGVSASKYAGPGFIGSQPSTKGSSVSASKNAGSDYIGSEPSAYATPLVRTVTEAYRNDLPAARAAGYLLLPTVDNCYDNPKMGGMGYHYINTSLLDTVVDQLKPEALVYDYNSSGKLQLVAVEYIVPSDAWDSMHSQPPSLSDQTFTFDPSDGTYSLHAWMWQLNPSGMFSDWNPKISQCRLAPAPRLNPNEAPS